MAKTNSTGSIRVGVGGWTFAPWRGSFYPEGLPAKRELEHASRHLTAIEINGTFYRSQGPKSFAKWREETPDNFVFTVKGHRAVVNAKVLGESGEAIEWFFKSGVSELGPKLGPILWQFAPFKKFNPDDLGAFLTLLPREFDGVRYPACRRGAARKLCRAGVRGAGAKAQRRDRLRRFRRASGDRRCHGGFRLRAAATLFSGRTDGLFKRRSRSLGEAREGLGSRRSAGGSDLCRRRQGKEGEARRFPVLHQRREGDEIRKRRRR